MNTLQETILELMFSVHELCKTNNITYYMVGGTMLGAVRHNGFIPWDDDIDISMPRKDFERFISIKASALPEWMEIIPPGKGPVNMGYAKVVNKETTLVEDYKGVRVGGIFIDIFPLDGIANSKEEAISRLKKIKLKTFMLRSNQGLSNVDSFSRKVVSFISKHISTEKLYQRYYKEVAKKDYYSCEYVANTVGVYEIKELTERRIYGTPKLYKFEKYNLYGVEYPDEFLRGLYGDYMKLPPVEKQASQHGVIYRNLNEPYREYLKSRKNE